MLIYRSHITRALDLAIKDQEEYEKSIGFDSDSAILATWRELREQVENGERVEFRD